MKILINDMENKLCILLIIFIFDDILIMYPSFCATQ